MEPTINKGKAAPLHVKPAIAVFSATPWPQYLRNQEPLPIMNKARWTSGSIRMGPENLTLPGFESRPSIS
jgi:hypothetical protein